MNNRLNHVKTNFPQTDRFHLNNTRKRGKDMERREEMFFSKLTFGPAVFDKALFHPGFLGESI